ncbi:MAG: STAS/SEC14 domain-containing protein [Pseudomonadota bacterium]|nr:STAS/SEC14 domain-containing protein [Pseudomonadota bacterium]
MISIRQHGSAILATILGQFQLSDFQELEADIDARCAQPGATPVDLLIDLRDMASFTVDVAWEELRYTRRHIHDFHRIAVVSHSQWAMWSAWIPRAFSDAEVRTFDTMTAAAAWLGVDDERPHRTVVSPAQLAAHPRDWVVFDCRHTLGDKEAGHKAYEAGHIPGAHFMDLDFDLAGPLTGTNGRHPLPDPEALAQRLGTLGVLQNTQVVAYDDAGGAFASRLWWLLRWIGHDSVAVLDGGMQRWQAENRPLVVGPDPHAQGIVSEGLPIGPEPVGLPIVLQHDTWVPVEVIEENLTQRRYLVIDARTPERFRGENETLDRVGGHIPGALNRYYRENLDAEGNFKTAAALREEFNRLLDGHAPTTVISQCGSGVTACHNLLGMEIAGLVGAKLYPGSWSEWSADARRPVAR